MYTAALGVGRHKVIRPLLRTVLTDLPTRLSVTLDSAKTLVFGESFNHTYFWFQFQFPIGSVHCNIVYS